jgi:hypothetical protein
MDVTNPRLISTANDLYLTVFEVWYLKLVRTQPYIKYIKKLKNPFPRKIMLPVLIHSDDITG